MEPKGRGTIEYLPELRRIHLLETVWKIGVGREAILRGPPRGGAGASIGRFLKPKTHARSPSEHFPDSFGRGVLRSSDAASCIVRSYRSGCAP